MEAKQVVRIEDGNFISAEPLVQPGTPRWTFVKNRSVSQTLRFKDGSTYKFRKIKTAEGYLNGSNVTTTDEKLAKNLRSLAGKNGVVEITPN